MNPVDGKYGTEVQPHAPVPTENVIRRRKQEPKSGLVKVAVIRSAA
jgi:hypothetical protein